MTRWRNVLVGTAATAALAGAPAFAQPESVKIGLLTVKTGPLAAGWPPQTLTWKEGSSCDASSG